MNATQLPVILSDESVLQRADAQGPRVGRKQIIEFQGKRFETLFWYNPNGNLLTITQFEIESEQCAPIQREDTDDESDLRPIHGDFGPRGFYGDGY